MERSSWAPPPPLPRRPLTYESPVLSVPRESFPIRRSNITRPTEPAGVGNARVASNSGLPSIRNYNNHTATASGTRVQQQSHPVRNYGNHAPATPGTRVQQQSRPVGGADTPRIESLAFFDHRRQLAIMVVEYVPSHATSTLTASFGMQQSRRMPLKSQPQNSTAPPGISSVTANRKSDRAQVTIQLYIKGAGTSLSNGQFLQDVDRWCRELQASAALQYLRHQLCKHAATSPKLPLLRVEAYDALPSYKHIINHSLNEQEHRGLKQTYDHIGRLLNHVNERKSQPGFVTPDRMSRRFVRREYRRLLREQIKDIHNGGGQNRRRRAALRAQLLPAFNSRRGPERNEANTNTAGPTWPFNNLIRQSEDEIMSSPPISVTSQTSPVGSSSIPPLRCSSTSPNATLSHSSPPQKRFPGQAQQNMNTKPSHQSQSFSLAPNLPQRMSMPPNPSRRGRGPSNPPPQRNHTRPNHPTSQPPTQSPASLMPPPPTPAPGHQRPHPLPQPEEGTIARPFQFNPFPFNLKSIYRGVSQPYHHIALVIDSPNWATYSGIGVLRFGYEHDWAKSHDIQRSGACLERVSMTRGMGRRWLGDVLAECFVGSDGDLAGEIAPAGVREQEEKVAWLAPEGSTDEDFELGPERGQEEDFGFGDEIELMDEETVRMLKRVSVPGAEFVDFLARENGLAV